MKIVITVLVLMLGLSASVEVQTFIAFTKKTVTQAEYAEAIEKNNLSALNTEAENILSAFNKRWPELELKSTSELADYVRTLEEVQCSPTGNSSAILARVARATRLVDEEGHTRSFRPEERCLRDNNTGELVVSLMCGNIVVMERPIFRSQSTAEVVRASVEANEANHSPGSREGESRGTSWGRHKWPIVIGAVGVIVAVAIAAGSSSSSSAKAEINIYRP